jgi:AraC-like DNA-binding protein
MLSAIKPDHSFTPHLVATGVILPPAGEWSPQSPGWSFIQIEAGAGYWMHPRMARDLAAGSVVIVSGRAQGYFRASQLGEVSLNFFRLEPERLTELASVNEQGFFQRAATREDFALRFLPPGDPLAGRFRTLCASRKDNSLSVRVQLLQIFLDAFDNELEPAPAQPARESDAKQRLANLLEQTPAAEWAKMAFPDLARRMHCTPRHLSRIFHELVGASFREKQTELRLTRARELLATTQDKVIDVALESGYQSQSLFNLLFKRRFGLSPARWRRQHVEKPGRRPRKVRLLAA